MSMEERGLDFTAYLTWIVIAIPTVTWQLRDHMLTSPRTLAWMACYAAFIICFYFHELRSVLMVGAQSVLAIARDLHDLLGHHLAALSINLEVARHLSAGEALEQIEKSQAVTKLLLSDVRDVVSRLREDEPVDLTAAVKSLGDVIQKPSLHL